MQASFSAQNKMSSADIDIAHVAIIMDGNGRWAKAKNLERTKGHQEGVHTVERVVEVSMEMGVKYLTLYTFSTENWTRPKQEVDFLFGLLAKNLVGQTAKLKKRGIRLRVLGDIKKTPFLVQQLIKKAMKDTSKNDKLHLNIAVNYSARWEMEYAMKQLAVKVKKDKISPSDINDELIKAHLTTAGMPDPDLLIRTGGEHRISNFLLYQIAYSELCFTKTCWPDFSKEEYRKLLIDYTKRNRTFGGVKN